MRELPPEPDLIEVVTAPEIDGIVSKHTNMLVETGGAHRRFWTEGGACRWAHKYPPLIPSYHLRVEKHGPFNYEVNAYQNIAESGGPVL